MVKLVVVEFRFIDEGKKEAVLAVLNKLTREEQSRVGYFPARGLEMNGRCVGIVASETEGDILGFIFGCRDKGVCELAMAVEPNSRGQGLANKMIREFGGRCQQCPFEVEEIVIETDNGNLPIKNAAVKHGFHLASARYGLRYVKRIKS